jgi:hypothetical protein
MLISDILYIFGYPLAHAINKGEVTGAGLVSLAVRDAGKDIGNLSYEDMHLVIQVYLKARLEKINILNCDAIIRDQLALLREKQSLFTMTAR